MEIPELGFGMCNVRLDRDVWNGNQLALINTIYCMTTYTSNLPALRN